MRVLITGVCGFAGSALARGLIESTPGLSLVGLDNLSRPGSERNRSSLRSLGVDVRHGDLRCASDLEGLGRLDWILDCAANPSVLAGVDGRASSRQVVEHNLVGTVHLLELARSAGAGFLLLSTSRVYHVPALASLPVEVAGQAFRLRATADLPPGVTAAGLNEDFSTAAPVSLYGATKLASEALALEYHHSFGVPVWINRCGVLAGAGQFGRADQGIFSYWLHAWRGRRPLRYIGFGGLGHQVRDALHPLDLVPVLRRQMGLEPWPNPEPGEAHRIFHLAGGVAAAGSLAEVSAWCTARWGAHAVAADPVPRPLDAPWIVLDAARARARWGFAPARGWEGILREIAEHAEAHPGWLDLTA